MFTKDDSFLISVDANVMTGGQLKKTALITKGFSGREIGKLTIAMQGAIYASKNGKFCKKDAWKIVERKVLENKVKRAMVGSNKLSNAYIEERGISGN